MVKAKDNTIKWKECFYLDDTSPSGLSWNKDSYSGKGSGRLMSYKGKPAGSRNLSTDSWVVSVDSVRYGAHRVVWYLMHGYIDDAKVVDHLDGNPLNNSRNNLELKTPKQNGQNKKRSKKNKSGIVGVNLLSKRTGNITHKYWVAQWSNLEGKRVSKAFSVNKLGHDQAKAIAVVYRTEQINLLNAAGASYTERHTGLTPGTSPATPSIQPT